MLFLLADTSWLRPDIIVWGVLGLVVIVPVIGSYLVQWRKSELDASLKSEMIARGMSADEIERVLMAKSSGKRG